MRIVLGFAEPLSGCVEGSEADPGGLCFPVLALLGVLAAS